MIGWRLRKHWRLRPGHVAAKGRARCRPTESSDRVSHGTRSTNGGDGRAGSLPLLPDTPSRPLVVGIGGSAGGLQATMALLETLGTEVPVAIVVVLHLSPDHESSATEILQRVTPLTVSQVRVRTRLEAGLYASLRL
ncbi:chemotaxis protein CheB [Caballeronia sp. LZ003]|nr:chemotaxis protein CheB [Caballeronia sp. LZ003]MDR5852839.1 chemotaxis protein CheB [Caballeronia sp. LZ003]